MNELTVIIAFRNEGEEVATTVAEIKKTAEDLVDIILVNDASEDQYPYQEIVRKYDHIRYIENPKREGCAASRETGIQACRTPYLLIIDAHMRFYPNQWWIQIIAAIKTDPRAIYCCRCVVWDYETKQERDTPSPYGAYLNLTDKDYTRILDVHWITDDLYPQETIIDIPCILGACYAASVEYWHYLRGLEGLKLYSYDETYISLKAWMEGGKCKLLKEVAIGHLFRQKFPYQISHNEFVYNRLFIASTLLPEELKQKIMKATRLQTDCIGFAEIKRQLTQNQSKTDELKDYYHIISESGFERFIKINALTLKNIVDSHK